jgi:hypothetical protein
MYANNPHHLEALQNIREAVYNIQLSELQKKKKSGNLFKIIQACLIAEDRHCEHL